MILVDSSVWIHSLRSVERLSTARLKQETARGNVLVGDIVLLEILRRARDDRHSEFLETCLRRFPVVRMMDGQLASTAAANYRHLRTKGITPRSLADLIIATFCIHHSHQLLQEDRDFAPMVEHLGLRLA